MPKIIALEPEIHRLARLESVKRGISLKTFLTDAIEFYIHEKEKTPTMRGVGSDEVKV